MNSLLLDCPAALNGQFTLHNPEAGHPPALVQTAFERWVSADGKRTGVIAGSTAISYHELNRQANAIARALIGAGIQPGQPVGLCLPRSIAQIAAVLGVLKAGAACLPLEPTYPAERIQFICRDAQPSLILTSAATTHLVAPVTGRKLLVEVLVQFPDRGDQPECSVKHHLPAYVIYTSGSTGHPKGVVMPHRALVNLLAWHESALPGPARTLQFAPLAFGVSFQEIFNTLGTGGTLVLMDESQRRDPKALWKLIKTREIERLFIPYVGLQQLAEVVDRRCDLREVITAGEQLRITPQIRRMFTLLAPCTLFNQYGPSETHVVTTYRLSSSPADWPAQPPIGKPIDRTHITLQPAPDDRSDEGEILVAGDCLSDGYLHRPGLNAEKFVILEDGRRYYRTGDLGRFLEDGNLQFLGRTDDQLRIRGFRVELGEVEAFIGQYPGIRAVSVAAKPDAADELRLVAYLVAEAPVSPSQLRAHLSARVPDHLVPSCFIQLPALPQTPSGKVNRRVLPNPFKPDDAVRATLTPPSALEAALIRVWSTVLGHDDFQLDDSFFEVGGDSLSVVRLQSQLQALLRVPLQLPEFYQYPDIRAFAGHLAKRSSGPARLGASNQVLRSQPFGVTHHVVVGGTAPGQPMRSGRTCPVAGIKPESGNH